MNHSHSPWKDRWDLDPCIDFLNHGSFGACPRKICEVQQGYRRLIEQNPVRLLHRELEPWINRSREKLSNLLGTTPMNLVPVANATSGINTVLRSLAFLPGQSLLVTNHGYNACRTAVDFVAERSGLNVQVAKIPCPPPHAAAVVDAILQAVDATTTLAIIDHVTSPTALILPLAEIIPALQHRGVKVLVDGAHGPGMVPIEFDRLGADFYTGNCHKWLCAPRGAAFLAIAPEHHRHIRPLQISHGANSTRTDRSRLHLEFDWTGTHDPSAWMCIADTLEFWEQEFEGGIGEVMQENRTLALQARSLVHSRTGLLSTAVSDDWVGSMVSLILPCRSPADEALPPLGIESIQVALMERAQIEVPVFPWPAPPHRILRFSCQRYNDRHQFIELASALEKILPEFSET